MLSALPLKIRRVQTVDLSKCVRILNRAYKVWAKLGVGSVTSKSIAADFQRYGFTIGASKIIGCFCLRIQTIQVKGNQLIARRANTLDTAKATGAVIKELARKKVAYLYKLAVNPTSARKGVGNAIMKKLEVRARAQGCDGILLETALETDWLVAWYLRRGFTVVARGEKSEHINKVFLYKSFT